MPLRDRRALIALIALCVLGAATIVVLGTRLSFFNDDWYFLLQRPGLESHGGLDTLLAPHNGNLVFLIELAYKVIVATFGLHSQVPYRMLLAATLVGLAVVVYRITSERVGVVLGLSCAAIILFLGPAWEVLLFLGAVNHAMATAFGLTALLLLERPTGRRDAVAAALLTAAVSVSPTGLAMVAGAVVAVLLGRRRRRLWIAAVPAGVFALWWAFYGHQAPSGVTGAHIAALPGYVFDAVSSGLSSGLGLKHGGLPLTLSAGQVLTAAAVVLLAVWLIRGGRPRPWALVYAVSALAFWVLTGASTLPGRGPDASRYQLVDVSLLLVLFAELAYGVELRSWRLTAAVGITSVIVVSNLFALRYGYDFMRAQSAYVKADLGALELAGSNRIPHLVWLTKPLTGNPYLSGITTSRYFAVTAAHGTPAYMSPQELQRAPAAQRTSADAVLLAAYALAPRVGAASTGATACHSLEPSTAASTSLPVGTTALRNLGAAPLIVYLRRFGDSPHPVAFLGSRSTELVTVPKDRADSPWRLSVASLRPTLTAAATVCSA